MWLETPKPAIGSNNATGVDIKLWWEPLSDLRLTLSQGTKATWKAQWANEWNERCDFEFNGEQY